MDPSEAQIAPVALRPRVATFLLAASMFLTGASGFIFECILSSVATFILGNSIEQFSVTISLMMLMMGCAGFWQRRLSDENLVSKFLLVEVALALLGGFAPIAVYAAYAGLEAHFLLVQYFFILAIGFLIGLEIPLVLRINRSYAPQLKANIASVFGMDYLGAFLGAVVWVYVLLRYLPLTEISFFVAAMNFAVALATYAYFSYHRVAPHGWGQLALIVLTAASLGVGYARNRDWDRALEQRFYSEPIAFSATTRYQHIVLTARPEPVDYRLYLNGNLQFSSVDEHIYHELLVHPALALADRRERVLILGGGDGLALREALKCPDIRSVTLVDIDPAMIEFARSHDVMNELNGGSLRSARVMAHAAGAEDAGQGTRPVYGYARGAGVAGGEALAEAARVQVFAIDADKMLRELDGPFDAILVDLPDPNSVELVKLYSREFYLKLHRVLRPGGMVAIQATSPYHAKESFLCILRTVRSAGYGALPYHDNVPSFGDWGWILAWASDATAEDLRNRIAALREFAVAAESLRYLTPERLRASLAFGKGDLNTDRTELNTLMAPVLLRFYLSESWLR